MKPVDKVRENRLRLIAARRGMVLRKSKRRDPRAVDFGLYTLRDGKKQQVLKNLDEVARAIRIAEAMK